MKRRKKEHDKEVTWLEEGFIYTEMARLAVSSVRIGEVWFESMGAI